MKQHSAGGYRHLAYSGSPAINYNTNKTILCIRWWGPVPTLNRHGDQAYMEDAISSGGGATVFEAIITYPNTETQIPSSYQYTYTLMGNKIVDTFDNMNPDEVNASLGLTGSEPSDSTSSNTDGDISSVDTNGNGHVTIKEAKAAGFSMPITSDHWLYPYMHDAIRTVG